MEESQEAAELPVSPPLMSFIYLHTSQCTNISEIIYTDPDTRTFWPEMCLCVLIEQAKKARHDPEVSQEEDAR